MYTFSQFISKLAERNLSPYHKQALARAHKGNRQSASTKEKISKSMAGKSNFSGKKHSQDAKNRIGIKRGDYDPIQGKSWIVNAKNQTYRKYHTPQGFKTHKRIYSK